MLKYSLEETQYFSVQRTKICVFLFIFHSLLLPQENWNLSSVLCSSDPHRFWLCSCLTSRGRAQPALVECALKETGRWFYSLDQTCDTHAMKNAELNSLCQCQANTSQPAFCQIRYWLVFLQLGETGLPAPGQRKLGLLRLTEILTCAHIRSESPSSSRVTQHHTIQHYGTIRVCSCLVFQLQRQIQLKKYSQLKAALQKYNLFTDSVYVWSKHSCTHTNDIMLPHETSVVPSIASPTPTRCPFAERAKALLWPRSELRTARG